VTRIIWRMLIVCCIHKVTHTISEYLICFADFKLSRVLYVVCFLPFPVPFLILVHSTHIYLPLKMEQTECSETSAYKIQTPGNYPKESIQK